MPPKHFTPDRLNQTLEPTGMRTEKKAYRTFTTYTSSQKWPTPAHMAHIDSRTTYRRVHVLGSFSECLEPFAAQFCSFQAVRSLSVVPQQVLQFAFAAAHRWLPISALSGVL